MKPKHIKARREKAVHRIWKRRQEIYDEMAKLEDIVLEKPIRHGWYKAITITRKVERYKNKAAILEVYNLIERFFWGRTKAEAQKKWETQTSKYLIYKDLPTLSAKQFNKLSSKAQRLCVPFTFYHQFLCKGKPRKKQKLRFYLKIPKGAYTLAYTRAYITHLKRIDPQLESELGFLDQQLLKPGYYEIEQKRFKWNRWDWDISDQRKEKLQAKRSLKSLNKYAIKDIINENTSWEIN